MSTVGTLFFVTERRFPPPWSVEELDAFFVVMTLSPAPRETSMRTAMDDCLRRPESGHRFQISVLPDAAETTVLQAPVQWASALLWALVALPFGAYHQYRPGREIFGESPMRSDASISRRVLPDLDSI